MEIKVERISRNTDTVRSDIKEESEGKTRTKTYANTQCKHITYIPHTFRGNSKPKLEGQSDLTS
jgi:hypothetical protein